MRGMIRFSALVYTHKGLYSLRACRKLCDHYTLLVKEDDGTVTISSEGEGTALENRDLKKSSDGRVIGRWQIKCG